MPSFCHLSFPFPAGRSPFYCASFQESPWDVQSWIFASSKTFGCRFSFSETVGQLELTDHTLLPQHCYARASSLCSGESGSRVFLPLWEGTCLGVDDTHESSFSQSTGFPRLHLNSGGLIHLPQGNMCPPPMDLTLCKLNLNIFFCL